MSALDRAIHITTFPSIEGKVRESQLLPLREFAEQLRTARAPTKQELKLFSCCSFDDRRTSKGSLRSDGNVRECFALVGDYDGGKTSPTEATEALCRADVAGLVVTTASHTPATPRFRVITPLRDPLHRKHNLGDYQKLISRLAGIMPEGLAAESWTLSQSWYIGTIDSAPDHTVLAIEGDYIDQRPDLDINAKPKPSPGPKAGAVGRRCSSEPQNASDEVVQQLDIGDALAALTQGRGSHEALVSLCGKFASQAVPMATAEAVILNAIDQRPQAGRDDGWQKMRGDVPRTLRWAYDKFADSEERYLRLLASAAPRTNGSGNGAAPPPPPPGSGPGAAPGTSPPQPGGLTAAAPTIAPIRFSENALALLFTAEHASDLLYVHEWGRWMRWQDGRWQEDPTVAVFDAVRVICADEGNTALKLLKRSGSKVATAINKAATVAAVERLARHHAPHVRPAALFDADILALNTPDSALDLRDPITPDRPHQRTDYMTRSTMVAPAATADCPVWLSFLYRIMGEKPEMVSYLQRVGGYMLTGSVKEHVLFFAHGTGANGKSTFANVLLGNLGTGSDGYAAVAPISTFTASRTEQHPTDLAMLRGVRCVVAHETEEGRSWAISKLKMMTGEDQITARFMRQDFFTYMPQFKLLILGNHKPALRGVDEATRRRFHLIPFDVTIPPAERDPELGDKLRAEYPAILRWMIEGCAAYIQNGLQPPQGVIAATEAYLADEDTFTAWLNECCRQGPGEWDTLVNPFASWKSWCEANGEYVGRRRELAKQFDVRGYVRHQDDVSRRLGWRGVRVFGSWERP